MKRTPKRRATLKRRNDREREQQRQLTYDRSLQRRMLQELGLWDDIVAHQQFERIAQLRYPKIIVRAAADTTMDDAAETVLIKLKQTLATTTWQPTGLTFSVTAQDYFTLLLPIANALSQSRAPIGHVGLRSVVAKARARTAELARIETYCDFLTCVAGNLREVVADHSRMNERIYYLTMHHTSIAPGQHSLRFELHHSPAQRTKLIIDGEPRWVYRCGQPGKPGDIYWVDWQTAELGISGPPRSLPVVVQQHAFDRIYGPDGRLKFIADGAPALHDLIWQSLWQPVLHPIPAGPNAYLVEYGFDDCKLGYLVAEVRDDVVLIKTFLFLTMDGTPEGNELRRRLQLTRLDKTYLELDRIETLLGTDVRDDPDLRQILIDCRCGHLFDELTFHGRLAAGRAAEIRRYLRLTGESIRSLPTTILTPTENRS